MVDDRRALWPAGPPHTDKNAPPRCSPGPTRRRRAWSAGRTRAEGGRGEGTQRVSRRREVVHAAREGQRPNRPAERRFFQAIRCLSWGPHLHCCWPGSVSWVRVRGGTGPLQAAGRRALRGWLLSAEAGDSRAERGRTVPRALDRSLCEGRTASTPLRFSKRHVLDHPLLGLRRGAPPGAANPGARALHPLRWTQAGGPQDPRRLPSPPSSRTCSSGPGHSRGRPVRAQGCQAAAAADPPPPPQLGRWSTSVRGPGAALSINEGTWAAGAPHGHIDACHTKRTACRAPAQACAHDGVPPVRRDSAGGPKGWSQLWHVTPARSSGDSGRHKHPNHAHGWMDGCTPADTAGRRVSGVGLGWRSPRWRRCGGEACSGEGAGVARLGGTTPPFAAMGQRGAARWVITVSRARLQVQPSGPGPPCSAPARDLPKAPFLYCCFLPSSLLSTIASSTGSGCTRHQPAKSTPASQEEEFPVHWLGCKSMDKGLLSRSPAQGVHFFHQRAVGTWKHPRRQDTCPLPTHC